MSLEFQICADTIHFKVLISIALYKSLWHPGVLLLIYTGDRRKIQVPSLINFGFAENQPRTQIPNGWYFL